MLFLPVRPIDLFIPYSEMADQQPDNTNHQLDAGREPLSNEDPLLTPASLAHPYSHSDLGPSFNFRQLEDIVARRGDEWLPDPDQDLLNTI